MTIFAGFSKDEQGVPLVSKSLGQRPRGLMMLRRHPIVFANTDELR